MSFQCTCYRNTIDTSREREEMIKGWPEGCVGDGIIWTVEEVWRSVLSKEDDLKNLKREVLSGRERGIYMGEKLRGKDFNLI